MRVWEIVRARVSPYIKVCQLVCWKNLLGLRRLIKGSLQSCCGDTNAVVVVAVAVDVVATDVVVAAGHFFV